MKKKEYQKIKKVVSLLMALILSLFSVNPVNADIAYNITKESSIPINADIFHNITMESPINREHPLAGGDEYKVVSNMEKLAIGNQFYWEDNSKLVLENGGRIRLFNYWDQDKSIKKITFWKIFFWTVVQASYIQTGGLLTMEELTRIRFLWGEITGGTIELISDNPSACVFFDHCLDASVKLIMRPSSKMAMYIGKIGADTITLLPGSFLRNPYIYVGSVVNAENDTEITFDGTVKKPSVYFWGKLNSKLNSKVNFNSVKHTTAKKSILTMDGGELKLSNSTLTLKPESFLNDTQVTLDSNSSLIFENNSLNTIYTPSTTGSIQVVNGTLRIVPKPIEGIFEYSVPTTVKGNGILEIKDRNVASTFITVKTPIINDGRTYVSDAIIANNITSTDGAYRHLYLFKTVTFADNISINQRYVQVASGITTLGKNINLSIDNQIRVEKDAKLLNPYSMISVPTLYNYGTIDGKDGKYGNLNISLNGYNTGSIIQNDITLNGAFNNSGFMESKGKFINNKEIWGNSINNTGSLTVNNAEFNGNIKQANLTVNGKAIQKADINLTKQLALSNSGAITNNTNKIIADSLYNRGSIYGDSTRGNSLEVNTGSNWGGITQQNITIKGNFTNNGAMEAFNFTTTPNTNISGESGTLRFNVGKNDGNITQKGITVLDRFENNKNVTANEYFYNAAGAITNNSLIDAHRFENKLTGVSSLKGNGNLTVRDGGYNEGLIEQNAVSFNGGTFDNKGTITANNFVNNALVTGDDGILNIKNGSTDNSITQKNITISGSFQNNKDITVKNELTISGRIIGNGNLTVYGGGSNGIFEIDQKDIAFLGGTFKNTGWITSTSNFVNNATITDDIGTSRLWISNGKNDKDITQKDIRISGTFTNNGNINVTGTFDIRTDAVINNLGTIDSGIFDNRSRFVSNTGTINSQVYLLSDGEITNTGVINSQEFDNKGTISNSGTIKVSTLNNSGTISEEGNLTIQNGGSNKGTIEQKNITLNSGVFSNYGTLISKDTFTNNGTINFEYDEQHLPMAVINKMDGTGTTNINGGIVSVGDVTQKNINVSDGLLSLVDDNADHRVNVTDNFVMSNDAMLAIDVDLTNKEGDYFKSDRITANAINNTVVNIAYANLLNISNDFTNGKIKLFGGNGVNSNLTINDFAEVVYGDTDDVFTYVFKQDKDNENYGDMIITKNKVEWTLPDVIGANTKILDETYKVSSYALKQKETLTKALGNLTNYEAAIPRELTIDGNNNIIDGNRKAGVIVNAGTTPLTSGEQKLTLKNVTMQNFVSDNGGIINNAGILEIDKVTFKDNKSTGDIGGGAIYNNVSGKIKNIQADFINNESGLRSGGAIYNLGTIDSIKGDFIGNSSGEGGAIRNHEGGIITKISSDFIANSAYKGGAIYNYDSASKLNVVADEKDIVFDGNYLLDTPNNGGAISNILGTVGLYALAGRSITFTGKRPDGVTNAYNIDSIFNNGTLNINGNGTDVYTGTVNIQELNGAGTTNIYGGIVNANGNFSENYFNNQGIFNFNAATGTVGALSDNTAAKGTTNINTGSFIVEGDLTQKAVTVNNGATLTTKQKVTVIDSITNKGTANFGGDVTVTNGIENQGILNFTGHWSTINSAIYGNGITNFGNGVDDIRSDVQKAILQAININARTNVFADVNNICGAVTNAGTLTLTGENSTISNAINGTGRTVINGTGLTSNTNIAQAITINSAKDLTINTNLIGGDVNNLGILNLLGGNLANNVTGEGTTNIIAGESISIANGKTISNLTLGTDSTLNQQNNACEKITIGNFNAGSNGNLTFDLGTVDNHDEIEILNSATGTLNLSGINIIGDDINTGTIHLFTGAGNKDTLNIGRIIVAISGTNNYYKFIQNSTNKGDIDILKVDTPNVPWTIQEVIAGQTRTTVPGELVPVDVYQLSGDMILDSDLGTFTKYPETRTRELTINGMRHLLDGNNIAKGVTINSDDTLTFNNILMKQFKDGAIHNDGEVSIVAQGGNAVKFEGNYLTTDAKGGAIYNGKTGSGDEAVLGTINLIAKTADDSITFVGGTETNKYDIDGIYNDGILDINADYDNIYSGTVNLNSVNGTGKTNIYGGTVTTKGDMVQNDLFIYDGASLTVNASNLKIANEEGMDNYGILNLAGGTTDVPATLNFAIVGTGTTNITSGSVTTEKAITQMDLSIANGAELTTGVNELTILNEIRNDGKLNLVEGEKGELGAAITGTGDTYITGAVISNGFIANNVTINANSSLEISAGVICDEMTKIKKNDGLLILDDGELTTAVEGDIQIKEGAEVFSDIAHFTGNKLENFGIFEMIGNLSKDILGNGTTVLMSNNVYANNGKKVEGILDGDYTTLILQSLDETYNKISVGGLKGATNLEIDVDMTNNPSEPTIATDSNLITLTGTSIQTEGENAVLNLKDILAYGITDIDTPFSTKTYNNFITYVTTDGGSFDNLTLKLNGHSKGEDGAKLVTAFSALDDGGRIQSREYAFTLGDPGKLNVDVKDTSVTLEQFIDGTTNTDITSFILASDYTTTGNEIGTTALGTERKSPLSIKLIDGTAIIAKEEGISKGITVDNGIELTVEGVEYLSRGTQGKMTGFDTALKVNAGEGNILNVNDMVITNNNNKTDIENNGTLNFGGSKNEVGTIKGVGSTNVVDGTLTVNKELTQGNVTLENETELVTKADILKVKNGINSRGTIVLNGGTLETDITGASGTTNITNEVTNNATIQQKNIVVESVLTNNNMVYGNISNKDNGIFNANENSIVQGGLTEGKFNSDGNNIFVGTLNPTDLNLNNGTLNMIGNLSAKNTVAQGGSLNLGDGVIRTSNLGNLAINNDMDLILDTDGVSVDKLSVDSVTGAGKINMMLNIPSRIDTIITSPKITFDPIANEVGTEQRTALAGAITYSGQSIMTPIFKYNTSYDKTTGLISVATASGGSENYNDFNPAIMAGAVAAQVGGYLNQLSSYDNAFEHMDTYMLTSKQQKTAKSMLNNMSASASNAVYSQPLSDESKGIWVKPYAVFEKVSLQGGPRVNNKMYGSFAGMDFDLVELRNDWNLMYSVYVSYDGSHQDYDGVNIYQNGGHLGAAATWYKENFFVGLTANVGASAAEASTMYGTDNMTTLMTGAATKAGYNIELANPNYVIQPSLMMSYSFVNTFDYTNAAGAKIKSDPLHSVQIAPGVKFVGNLPHEWQPYVAAQMVWNMIDETKFTANNINLPGLSTKRYFQYGVGAQKRWGDSFSGYLQAMMRNEGRTGVAFNAGIRWAFGNN